jgi:hypothetical protein
MYQLSTVLVNILYTNICSCERGKIKIFTMPIDGFYLGKGGPPYAIMNIKQDNVN